MLINVVSNICLFSTAQYNNCYQSQFKQINDWLNYCGTASRCQVYAFIFTYMHTASIRHSSLSVNVYICIWQVMNVDFTLNISETKGDRGLSPIANCKPIGNCPRGVKWSLYWWHQVTQWHRSGDVNVIAFKMLLLLQLLSELDDRLTQPSATKVFSNKN